jgi:hypothetical protein
MTTRFKNPPTRFAAKAPRFGDGATAVQPPQSFVSPAGIHTAGGQALSSEEARATKALARMGMPADLKLPVAGLLPDLAPVSMPGLGQIRIAFDGSQTVYEWGPWLQAVNQNPYKYYLPQTQPATQIVVHGIDPVAPATQSTRWGRVVLSLNAVKYSSRFGGSIYLRLTPDEDYGIELSGEGTGTSRIHVNLDKWLLHLWIQPSKQLFNTPWTAAQIATRVHTELEAAEYECYEWDGQRFVPHTTATPEAVASLFAAAASEAQTRLQVLEQFALGYVHAREIPTFDYHGDAVEELLLSDGMCAFQTRTKTPYVQVQMNTHYLGTAALEGMWDEHAEVTAEPWIILRDPNLVVASIEKRKYIGSGSSTGFLTFDYLTLAEIERVRRVTVFASCSEEDPIENDYASSNGFGFDVSFDKAQLQADAAANHLGQIGSTWFGLQNDPLVEGLSYAAEIRFDLVKL